MDPHPKLPNFSSKANKFYLLRMCIPCHWLQSMYREVEEETGIPRSVLSLPRVLPVVANNIMRAEDGAVTTHTLSVFVEMWLLDTTIQPRLMEPDKCAEWRWVRYSDRQSSVPRPMFTSLQVLIDSGYEPGGADSNRAASVAL